MAYPKRIDETGLRTVADFVDAYAEPFAKHGATLESAFGRVAVWVDGELTTADCYALGDVLAVLELTARARVAE